MLEYLIVLALLEMLGIYQKPRVCGRTGYYYLVIYIELIAIISDTNVLIKSTFNDVYDGIHIHDQFYAESSQLLDEIKDKKISSVSGGLLSEMKKEYRYDLLESVFWDLDTAVGMQQIVKEVAREIAIEVASCEIVREEVSSEIV